MSRSAPVLVICFLAAAACGRVSTVGELQVPEPESWEGFEPPVHAAIEAAIAELRASGGAAGAWERLGMVYHANDVIDLAKPCYERALAGDDEDGPAWYLLARIEAAVGELEAAVAASERARELEPGAAWLHWRRGYWLMDLGQVDEATASFSRALELEPDSPAAVVGLARLALLDDRADDVIRLVGPLLHGQALPNRVYVQDLLGRALQRVGRGEEAAALISGESTPLTWTDPWSDRMYEERALPEWLIQRAHSRIVAGDPEAGLELLEPLREWYSDDPALNKMLGMALFALGRSDEAIGMLERAIAARPNDFSSYLNLGLVFEKMEAFDDAERFSRQAVVLNPTSVEARMQHARALHALERHPEALELVRPVVGERPEWGAGWVWLARILVSAGELEDGSDALAKARRYAPRDPQLAIIEAQLVAARGQ